MVTCCEIALTLALTNIVSLAIFAGYTLRVSRRTLKLEKKNGHEQEQINQLKKEIERLKKRKKSND
jgi:cell division protein FtsL